MWSMSFTDPPPTMPCPVDLRESLLRERDEGKGRIRVEREEIEKVKSQASEKQDGEFISPLTLGPSDPAGTISVARLVDAYRQEYGIDVTGYLPDSETIDRRRCRETGLLFFSPRGLAGPPKFYAELYSGDEEEWAYQNEKWEFVTARRLIAGANRVLDIGCGGGAFLDALEGDVISRFGLETSPFGREQAQGRGLEVFDETIGDHVEGHRNQYDAVTAFQVLEHVDDPRGFISSCVEVLKPGGTLVLSVPNQDAFLRHCDLQVLNLPPHHVTLWPRSSLVSVAELFALELVWLEAEALQNDITGWFQSVLEERYLAQSRALRWLYYRLGGSAVVRRAIEENRENIDGHTILAAYRKPA